MARKLTTLAQHQTNTMITLHFEDEYGSDYAVDTFETIEDARDALWNLECALEDARSATRYYKLQHAIIDLREQIEQHEDSN